MVNPASILNVILNLDPNRSRREATSRLLFDSGLSVHESASGREALQLVSAINPDVVLAAGKLPDIGGLDLCRQLRATPGFTSLILLRGAAREDPATENLPDGPDAWLPSRLDHRHFLSTVHTLVRLSKAQRELSATDWRSQTAAQRMAQIVEQCYEEAEESAFKACHDLEEPVRALSAFKHILEQNPGRLSPEENMFLEQAFAGTERLRRLFGALRSYSQIPRDHKPAPRTVDLNLALRTATRGLDKLIQDSAAEIRIAKSLPRVSGNLARLQQVFECLLTNAIQYRRPEQRPVIWIDARDHVANQTVISVTDNGAGIASQYHQIVFQPYKRLHGREIPGSGMGLAIAKRIVEAHQGRMWVESEPGNGATFFFSLLKANPGEQTAHRQ